MQGSWGRKERVRKGKNSKNSTPLHAPGSIMCRDTARVWNSTELEQDFSLATIHKASTLKDMSGVVRKKSKDEKKQQPGSRATFMYECCE